MKFNVNQQELQQALNYCQGVIEKRSTLPILSNVLLDVSNEKLTITATDLDLIFIHQIKNIEILEQGKTTTTMTDIIFGGPKVSDRWKTMSLESWSNKMQNNEQFINLLRQLITEAIKEKEVLLESPVPSESEVLVESRVKKLLNRTKK